MKRYVLKLITFALAALLAFGCCAGALAAGTPDLTDADGGIVGIAHRGDWTNAPENSIPALLAAAQDGLAYVLADVSVTKDGVPVLLEGASAKRMLGAEKENTAELTFAEITALPLKNRMGGKGSKATGYTVPTLAEALAACEEAGITLVLQFDVSQAETILAVPGAERCALYPTGDTAETLALARKTGKTQPVIAGRRSNIIFSVLSFFKKLRAADAAGAVLKTTNRFGVIYYPSTLKKCEGLRAVADLSDPHTAGARQDTEKWWDDLIGRGYGAIITDDPAAFAEYALRNDAARARLQGLYDEVQTMDLPDLSRLKLSDYKKAYADALADAEALLADRTAATVSLRDAYTALKNAVAALETNYEAIAAGTAERTVTLPRILLCIGSAVAVFFAQLYFFKRRKKA